MRGVTPVRILIADDPDAMRQDVRAMLEAQPEWNVCGVLHVSMPESNGMEATRQSSGAVPAKILILTVPEPDQVVMEEVGASADGCVPKTEAGRTLVEAICALLRDQRFVAEPVRTVANRQAGRRRGGAATPDPARLTTRQREVLRLLAEGRSNKEVGAILGVTTKTAETHRTQIMAKLDLHSMSELVRYAVRNRIIEP